MSSEYYQRTDPEIIAGSRHFSWVFRSTASRTATTLFVAATRDSDGSDRCRGNSDTPARLGHALHVPRMPDTPPFERLRVGATPRPDDLPDKRDADHRCGPIVPRMERIIAPLPLARALRLRPLVQLEVRKPHARFVLKHESILHNVFPTCLKWRHFDYLPVVGPLVGIAVRLRPGCAESQKQGLRF